MCSGNFGNYMDLNNSIVDIISGILIIVSIFLSYSRGLVRECYTVIAWILSFFSSIKFGPIILPFILHIPFLEEFLLGNCPLAMLISYVITFILSLAFFSIVIILLNISKTNESTTIFNSFDKFGGIIFGFIRSLIILVLLLIFTQDILPDYNFKNEINDSIKNSATHSFLDPSKRYISDLIYENGEIWLKSTYNFILSNECK